MQSNKGNAAIWNAINQTEINKSELDKANVLADPDFAQTELAKDHVLQIWNPINQNLECNQTTKQL
jgi:hypothetical protein